MKYATLAAVAAMAAMATYADKVTLKSGSFLTGEAGLIQNGALNFKSEDIGDIKIAIGKIASLDVEKASVIQYNDGTVAEKPLTVRDGAVWAEGKALEMANVKAINPPAETWHGSVNFAYQAARGNTYDNAASIVANLNRRWEKDRLNVDFGYFYGENGKAGGETQKTTDRWEIEAKHDHFWWEKVYHYENGRFDKDDIQDLRARYRLGLGGGYQWLENRNFEATGKWSFNQEVGINWVKEEYEHNDDTKKNGFAALRYAHHFGYVPKWYGNVEFFHNFEILPEADEWEKFLAKANIGFSTKILLDFDLLVKMEWDYNSKPASERKKDDLRYIVGLGYKW